MKYSYHNHTYRCNHATGTEEEYIKNAHSNGIVNMGFSDHIPFVFPDGFQSGHRMKIDEVNDYFTTLNALREKYKKDMNILIGFEVEGYPLYLDELIDNGKKFGAQYMILGHHYINNEHPDGLPSRKIGDNEELFCQYVDDLINAMKTGAFTYVAHPDICCFTGSTKIFNREMKKLCLVSKNKNIPLEINFNGIRGNKLYPDERLWNLAGKIQCPVTFGIDAHSPEEAFDKESLDIAKKIVEKYNLNYIGEPKIIYL